MSARDPILSSSARQSELTTDSYVFLSNLEYPLCLRNLDGEFVYTNSKFVEYIKGYEYSITEWFNRLPVETRCELLSCELGALASPNIGTFMNLDIEKSYQYCVLFYKIVIDGTEYATWSFFDKLLFKENGFYFGLKRKIKSLDSRNPAIVLEPPYYKVFCLYFSGFSHEFISSLLKVNVGTSKNRISKAYSIFGISGRDEMILYLKSNSYLHSVIDHAFYLISICSEKNVIIAAKKRMLTIC